MTEEGVVEEEEGVVVDTDEDGAGVEHTPSKLTNQTGD